MNKRVIAIVIIALVIGLGLILTLKVSDSETKTTQETTQETTQTTTMKTTLNTTTEITQTQTTYLKKKKKKTTKKKTTKKKSTKKKSTQKHSKAECMNFAHNEVINRYHWSETDWNNLVKLWNRESGWNAAAVNKRSGACGIPQALPCSKMKSRGSDYKTNCYTQINWGLGYISARYGSPSKAWQHSQRKGWY